MKLFVAGSGTDVGKTYVTAGLIRRWRLAGRRVRAVKPLASGLPPVDDPAFVLSDPGVLLQAQGEAATAEALAACSPWRFAAPLSPDMAAAAEGRSVALREIVDWTKGVLTEPGWDDILVEGVGGVMSPITPSATGLDLAAALDLPTLLVCGSYLGAISHGLTAMAALQGRGLRVAALVVNETAGSTVGLEATMEAVQRFAGPTPVHVVRRGENPAFDLPPA